MPSLPDPASLSMSATTNPSVPTTNMIPSTPPSQSDAIVTILTNKELMMHLSVMFFITIALVLVTLAVYRVKKVDISDIIKLYGTIIVIASVLILTAIGFDQSQIAGPLGLLGAIAGYIFGQSSKEKSVSDQNEESKKGTQTESTI